MVKDDELGSSISSLSRTLGASRANGAAKRHSDAVALDGRKAARIGRSPLFSPPLEAGEAGSRGSRSAHLSLGDSLQDEACATVLQWSPLGTDYDSQRHRSAGSELYAERTKPEPATGASTMAVGDEVVRDEINLVDPNEGTSSSSEEDDESLFESPESKRRRNRQHLKDRSCHSNPAARGLNKGRPRLEKARDINAPLSAMQQACLDQIERREDKHLLRLFWVHGWAAPADDADLDMACANCFVFLKHQFLAVRFVAGVSDDWPQKYPPTDWPSASLNGCMHGSNPWKPGGGILGDMMGLGKTIELLGGAFLREILHAHHDLPAKNRVTMIVLPNDPVCDQWRTAAIKAGITANEIGIYTGKDGVLPSTARSTGTATRYTLTTIHRLQADAKRAFDSWEKSDYEPRFKYSPSPLALQLTAKSALWLKMKYLRNSGKSKRAQIPDWLLKIVGKKSPFEKKGPKEIIAAELRQRQRRQRQQDNTEDDPTYLTFIIDEAHIIRNNHAYWSLLAIAMGSEAQRVIPATGTPFNNSMQDMATLEAYIDPRTKNIYNTAEWWKAAFGPAEDQDETPLSKEENDEIIRQVTKWRETGFLRREHSVLTQALPKRTDVDVCVTLADPELSIYRVSEAALMRLFKRLHMLHNSNMHAQTRLKKLRKLLMQILAMIMVADMQLLHPVLSNQGREITKLFSPSRSQLFETDKDRHLCVVCSNGKLRTSTPTEPHEENHEQVGADDEQDFDVFPSDSSEEDEEGQADVSSDECTASASYEDGASASYEDGASASDEDEASLSDEDEASTSDGDEAFASDEDKASVSDEDEASTSDDNEASSQHVDWDIVEAKRNPHPILGKLIEIPRSVCVAQRGPGGCSSHWCHEKCLEQCLASRSCPRCDFLNDMLGTGAVVEGDSSPTGADRHTASALPVAFQPRLCANVAHDANGRALAGFVPSSKLLALQHQLNKIDLKEDKVIVFSKFRGFLDLVEAMLHHEMRVQVERFDGDEDKISKAAALKRFCSTLEKRVLLATVQSGGVGLNITAANHVIFCDRWFNPMIHEQAICRAHRLGQTKLVRVVHLDAEDTVNSVIKDMMLTKLTNASKILRDGTDVGASGGGSNGMGLDAARTVGQMLAAMVHSRHADDSDASAQDVFRDGNGCAAACAPSSRDMAPEHKQLDGNEGADEAGGAKKAFSSKDCTYSASSTGVADLSSSDVDSDDEQLHARSTKLMHTMKPEAIREVIDLAGSDEYDT